LQLYADGGYQLRIRRLEGTPNYGPRQITKGRGPEFMEDEQGTIGFKNRICVPDIDSLRETILKEAHDLVYSIHPGSTKMYQDLKQKYW
jgi:hypothetical protein